jgi:hypothetical protein
VSYLIIPVYSFQCDMCNATFDCTPGNQKRRDEQSLLVTAQRLLEDEGWEARGHGSSRMHLCPRHKGDRMAAVMPLSRGTCRGCSRDISVRGDGRVRNHSIKGTGRRCSGSGQVPS